MCVLFSFFFTFVVKRFHKQFHVEHDDHFEFHYFCEHEEHSVAVTVYYVGMYDCVTRMVRFITLRMK